MEKEVHYMSIFYIVIYVEVVFENWELRRDKLWSLRSIYGETKIYKESDISNEIYVIHETGVKILYI
jgi:hypothetical protein